jgi:hypothetical protein
MGEEAVARTETGFVGLVGDDDGTIRVNVYREAFWLPLGPNGLTFRHPRPAALPSSLDVFLWGGMHTVINDICAVTNARLFHTYLLCVLLAEFLVCCPQVWPWQFWMVYFDTRLNMAYSLTVCVGSLWLAWGLTRPTIAAMHRSLDAALDEQLAPSFKRAGFRLQLLHTMTNRFSAETSIMIEPLAKVERPYRTFAHRPRTPHQAARQLQGARLRPLRRPNHHETLSSLQRVPYLQCGAT